MSTYTTKHGVGDKVFYIGTDFKAKQGIVTLVQVQEQVIPIPTTGNKLELTYETNPDGSLKTTTYVQYGIDGQHMHEGRVFTSIEDLVEHVRDGSK